MQVTNNAEGGTTGTAVTTANTGGSSGNAFTAVTIGTSAVFEFNNSQKAGGALSYRSTIGATSAQSFVLWDSTVLGNPTRVYGRLYFRLPNIVVNRELIRWRRASTQIARLRVDVSTGVLELRQGNNSAPATSGGTGTVTLSANTWYRVEWDIQAGTLTNTIYLYLGDSTTPLETITGNGVFSTAGAINEVAFGQFTAVANVGDLFFDDLVVNDTGLPGPARTNVAYTRTTSETLTQVDALGRSRTMPRAVDGNPLGLADTAATVGTRARAIAETAGLGDAAASAGGRPRGTSEVMTLGDSAGQTRGIGRGVAESSILADSWARQVAGIKAVAESLGLGHVFARGSTAYARPVSEPITVADTAAARSTRARAVAEPVSAVDSTGAILVRGRGTSESVQALDVATRTVARPRALPESMQLADSPARQISRSAAVSEALALVDALSRTRIVLVGSPNTMTSSDAWGYTSGRAVGSANTFAAADTAGRSTTGSRGLGEGVTLGHLVATGRGVMVAAAEAIALADTFARAVSRSRSWSEFVALDGITATRTALNAGAGETVGLAEAFAVGRVVLTGTGETVVLVDAAGRQLAGGADVDEALALAQTVARIVVRGRGPGEVLAIGNTLASGQWVQAGVAQGLTLGHTFTRNATTFVRLAPQSLTLADTVARGALSMARAIAQPLGVVDALQAGRVLFVGSAELVDLDDAAGRVVALGRGYAEAIALAHTVARSAIARARGTAEILAMSDTAQTGRVLAPSASEQVLLGDAWSRGQTTGRVLVDAVVLGHAVSRVLARARAAGEGVQLVDGWLAQREIIPVTVAGEIAFNDGGQAKVARSRAGASALGMVETAGRRIDRARTVPEGVTLAELARAIRGQSVGTAGQPMTLDDIARASTARTLAVAQTVLLFATAAAGDLSGNPIVVAHAAWVRMSRPPVGRVRMTRSPGGGVRMTEGG